MNKDKTTFTWQAEDGYAGGARPLHTKVDNSEIQDCETLEEAVQLVEQYIRDDFQEKVSPGWDDDKLRAKVEEIWNQREK